MSKKQFTLEIDSMQQVAKRGDYYSSNETRDVDVTPADIYEALSKFLLEKGFSTSIIKVEDES